MAWWRPGNCESPTHGVGAGAAAAVALAVGIWRRERIGRQVSTTVSRLGTIPATITRQRRRRRRAKALNQAVTGAAQQTTALARAMARLVAGTALLPVTVAVGSGRRARAGIQTTRKAISQGCPAGSAWSPQKATGGTLGLAAGGAAGYVLGAKAGRQRYQELTESARRLRQRPEVERATEQAVAKLDQLSGQAADKLQAARQSPRTEAGSNGGQPIAVVPETPTVTPPSPTVMPPADLAPMPAEPTVLPGEDTRLLRSISVQHLLPTRSPNRTQQPRPQPSKRSSIRTPWSASQAIDGADGLKLCPTHTACARLARA